MPPGPRPKCRFCGKEGSQKDMYKVVTGGKNPHNTYYCNKDCWEKKEYQKKKPKKDRDNVYYFICDIFGYKIQHTQLFAEWTKWNKLKSNEDIYEYLKANKTYLQNQCDRFYDNEYSRIMYFSAILKNSLRDFKSTVEVPKMAVVEEHYETKYNPKTRQALEDFEDE